MNDDATLYSKNCDVQKCLSKHIIDTIQFSKSKNGIKVLDVGSAEGSVALEVLLPKLPSDFSELILIDISEKMLNLAKHRINDSRIHVVQLDISAKTMPDNFEEYFDYIVSFYCLNYIAAESQVQALKNIYLMLKPGGEILLIVVVSGPPYEIYENLIEMDKWRPYSGDFVISPFHRLQSPSGKMENYLESAGFVVHECKDEVKSYAYDTFDDFVGFTLSIIPMMKKIPESQHGEFLTDLKKVTKTCSMLNFETRQDGKEKINMLTRLLIVRASKPI